MSGKVFKKPSYRMRKFGVDNEGRDGLSSFFNEWGKDYNKNYIKDGGLAFLGIVSSIAGLALYAGGQIYEYNADVNERPSIPAEHLLSTDADAPLSFVSILTDPDRRVTNIMHSDHPALEYVVLHNEEAGTYEINQCTYSSIGRGSYCNILSADEVRELRGELRLAAEESDYVYLSPEFFYPHKLIYMSEPLAIEENVNGIFVGNDEFVVEDGTHRYFSSDAYEIDDKDQPLNSPHFDFDVEGITNMWRAALDAPDNGTYQLTASENTYVWPRVEGEEWQDSLVSSNAAGNAAVIFALISGLTAAGAGISAARKTKTNTRPLKGFEMLKHKPK